nr:MAG TPA: hypothetical protein [Caudoviricetes sp.]
MKLDINLDISSLLSCNDLKIIKTLLLHSFQILTPN